MMNLMDIFKEAIKNDLGDHRKLDPETTAFIKVTLANDALFKSIHPSNYDAVIITEAPVEIGERMFGVIFDDKKKRFSDGDSIITTHVKSITKLRHELYRVETIKTNYLVVM